MARKPIPSWFFALVVVRRGDEFLLVQELHHGQGWYLPGGRVEAGETLTEAALRETLEESGVPIVLEGIVRVEHTPVGGGARVRVVFLARPADDTPPRRTANEHTLGAAWVRLEDMEALELRSGEVRAFCSTVARGAPVAPLSLLGQEG
jgi:phosphatase NudJ